MKGTVCVTGGTGFYGSWLVKLLLEDGYSVNTTTRMDPDNKRDISYLTNLPGASKRLKIFNADLDKPETFSQVIQGCIGVFHTAHPLDFEQKETEQVKAERVIAGVQGILQACVDSKTVRRVVLTASLSTALFSGSEPIDESSWSDFNVARREWEFGAAYTVTKVLAERTALEFAKKHGLDVVSVLPSWTIGPFLCPRVPDTVQISLSPIFGDEKHYYILKSASLVHIDDVMRAHIHLFELPSAEGRYICTGVESTMEELCELISARYPEYKLPTPDSWKDMVPLKTSGIPSNKLLQTGFSYQNGLKEMLDDAIKCCKEKGLL